MNPKMSEWEEANARPLAFVPAFTSSYGDSDGEDRDREDAGLHADQVYAAGLVTGFAAGEARCSVDLPEDDHQQTVPSRDSSYPAFVWHSEPRGAVRCPTRMLSLRTAVVWMRMLVRQVVGD